MKDLYERGFKPQQGAIDHETAQSIDAWFLWSFSFSTQLILLRELGLENKKHFSAPELRTLVKAAIMQHPLVQQAEVVEFDPEEEAPIPFATLCNTCVGEIGANGLVYLCREQEAWVLKYTAQAINENKDERWNMPHHTPADQIERAWFGGFLH